MAHPGLYRVLNYKSFGNFNCPRPFTVNLKPRIDDTALWSSVLDEEVVNSVPK